jgi:DNA-binding transcriptional ArsR family regulator
MAPDEVSRNIPDQLEDAFSVLASEPRLEILFTLLDQGTLNPLSFSELHERVGTIDSGQLNYHLKQLTDLFISRTDEGYRLQFSGIAVCRSMMAALGVEQPQIDSFDLDSTCPDCGTTLSASYEHEHVVVQCPNCEGHFHRFPFPPGTLAKRTSKGVLRAYDRWIRAHIMLAVNGLCLWCFGRMTPEITTNDDASLPHVQIDYTCGRCTGDICSTIGESLLTHPAVVSFYYDHGIDLSQTPSWTLEFLWNDEFVTVVSDDPWRIRLTIPLDNEVLELTINENINIIEINCEGRSQ